jgi:hypothetical protein
MRDAGYEIWDAGYVFNHAPEGQNIIARGNAPGQGKYKIK